MIKYFCDLCKEEINEDEHYAYILPLQIPYNAISAQGELLYTYKQLEDREIEICDICRRKISQILERIEFKERS